MDRHWQWYCHFNPTEWRSISNTSLSERRRGLISFYSDLERLTKPDSLVRLSDQTSSSIPYSDINRAQFSLHGYRDAVKFFIAVPGQISEHQQQGPKTIESTPPDDVQVWSGGDGYIDFRLEDRDIENNRHISYLIAWQFESNSF